MIYPKEEMLDRLPAFRAAIRTAEKIGVRVTFLDSLQTEGSLSWSAVRPHLPEELTIATHVRSPTPAIYHELGHALDMLSPVGQRFYRDLIWEKRLGGPMIGPDGRHSDLVIALEQRAWKVGERLAAELGFSGIIEMDYWRIFKSWCLESYNRFVLGRFDGPYELERPLIP